MPQGRTNAGLTAEEQHRWGWESLTTCRQSGLNLNGAHGNGALANRVSMPVRNSHIGLLLPWCQAHRKCSLNLK